MRVRSQALVTAAALLALLVSGCAGTGTTKETATSMTSDGHHHGHHATSTTTTTAPPQPRIAELAASVRNGTAPLPVTFGLKSQGEAPRSWRLDFGDGLSKEGSALPATALHNYTEAGTYVATLRLDYATGSPATASLSIGVLPPAAKGPLHRINATATVAVSQPVSACGAVDPADPLLCTANQAKSLHEQDPARSNGTFFLWYDVDVPAGASTLQVRGGSTATQSCHGVPGVADLACIPDFDLALLDPSGAWTLVGTFAALEQAVVEGPAAGTWAVLVIYYAGPPNGAAVADITVLA